ncbi:MAG TPA: radical SAM/SPASM family putative metalloenzyme maturase [Nitrospirae bacterium]|nr:radical SAM/SPASM family putative metalloenzyme maturase [Nitrospirota bacterium]
MAEEKKMDNSLPGKLFVEVTTRCNLHCGMCVKQTPKGEIMEGDMREEIFLALRPLFKELSALILNGIGEPLLFKDLERFIEIARAEMSRGWIGFQTNGMLMSEKRAHSLMDSGVDRICISIDSTSGDLFKRIRKGGEVTEVERAFRHLIQAKRGLSRDDFQLGIEFVLMKDNIHELPATIEWAAERGVTFAIVTQVLPYDSSVVSQAVYDTNTHGAIEIYKKYSLRAWAAGIRLSDFSKVYMKFRKNEYERQVCELIEEMKKEAAEEGIVLHIENLFSRDEEWFRRAEEILKEAAEIAAQRGMEIVLPELAPRNTRRCEFVESDSVFVSWDGRVHPCYFLWHQYNCYIGGIEKMVRPWVFGDLRESSILEIWNSDRFRNFRNEVRRYEFPFCFDCGFALCNYVQDADFEQDCYTLKVPCGACLWCTGLFHCLQ